MTAMKNNFWAFKDGDGNNRAHVPATPMWIAIVRAVQLVSAVFAGLANRSGGQGKPEKQKTDMLTKQNKKNLPRLSRF